MKTFRFMALALLASAMGFASCDNDEVGDEGNEEYLFEATCEPYFDEGEDEEETVKAYEATLHSAMTSVGFTKEDAYTLSITGKDSASVSKVLLEKMKQVESRVAESPYEVKSRIMVNRLEYRTLNPEDEARPYYTEWCNKLIGIPSNNYDPYAYGKDNNDHHYRFVKSMRTIHGEEDAILNGDYFCRVCGNMNFGTRDFFQFMYIIMEHSGKQSQTANKFTWESQCENQYITDVVALYSDWIVKKPNALYIDDRPYYKEEAVQDLNKGVGGEYIYLYVCRQKYAESDGKYYYLNTGGQNPVVKEYKNGEVFLKDPGYGCRSFSNSGWFDVNKYVHKSYTAEGHKFVERVLQLYTPKWEEVTNSEGKKEGRWIGKHECDIELNRGAGGYDIRMILSYATKEGGY